MTLGIFIGQGEYDSFGYGINFDCGKLHTGNLYQISIGIPYVLEVPLN